MITQSAFEQARHNGYSARLQALTWREQDLLDTFLRQEQATAQQYKKEVKIHRPAGYRQKRDLTMYRTDNGQIYLGSEYPMCGNGYYYVVDEDKRKKLLVDID